MLERNAVEILEKFCNDLYIASELKNHNIPQNLLQKRIELENILLKIENEHDINEHEIQFLRILRTEVINEIYLVGAIDTLISK